MGMTYVDLRDLRKGLSPTQLAEVQAELGHRQKHPVVAYLLWFFLGVVGGHRFYLGDIGYALGLLFTGGGFGLWALIDVAFISGRLRQVNMALEAQIIREISASQAPAQTA